MESWPAAAIPSLPGDGPPLRLFDAMSGTVRSVATTDQVSMYVCGITPYDATHLGHAATYLAFDMAHRVLVDAGIRVDYCQNVTDIDDPLLERASATGEDWAALAARETTRFRRDMAALRVLPPRWYVGAVEAIDEISDLVVELQRRGAAYDLDGDVYFSVAAAAHFGTVAGLDPATMLQLSAERGGDPHRPGKKDPLDPVLWQAARPGDPAWDSPLGPGRPGWHVECAAIALRRLGTTIDIQGGGRDLVFPHHELGAAEASVATGGWPFARFFVHTGMVGYAGEKMSKSRGNLVLVSRLVDEGAEPAAIRLALLDGSYRADREWTPDLLTRATARLDCWRRAVRGPGGPSGSAVLTDVRRHLADDLDTPAALARVDAWAERACGGDHADPGASAVVRDLVDALFGIGL